jgi:deoxyribonuclease V
VAGTDVGFDRRRGLTRAAVVVLSLPALETVDEAVAEIPTRFPYVPGLLSFREIPALLAAFEILATTPDAVLCDGQGRAHPRRFGLACHLGVLLDLPTAGVAKSRLVGTHGPVPAARGSWTRLEDGGEVVGAVLRTRAGVRPVYVSIGHRLDLGRCIDLVMACTGRYRLPETTRRADRRAAAAR